MDQLCSTGNLCPDFSESVFSHFGIPKYCWSILLPLMQTHFPSWQINLLEVIPRKTDKGLVGRNLKKPDCSLYERLMHNEIWETCTAVSLRLELCQTLKIQDSLVRYVSDIFFFFFSPSSFSLCSCCLLAQLCSQIVKMCLLLLWLL